MKDEKLIELFRFYVDAAVFEHQGPKRLDDSAYKERFLPTGRADRHYREEAALQHASWMAGEAIKFLEEAKAAEDSIKTLLEAAPFGFGPSGITRYAALKIARSKREKAHRWLGFIQGVLWMAGCFTLDELKEHSHKCSDDYEEKRDGGEKV